jgi:hypothetical protein
MRTQCRTLVKTSNGKENFNFVWRKKKAKGIMILVNLETKKVMAWADMALPGGAGTPKEFA